MNLRQKIYYAVAGFVGGNIVLASLVFGVAFFNRNSLQTNEFDYRQTVSRISSSGAHSVNIISAAPSPTDRLLFQLFRILFILFIISPPIIVILLLVIISKMDRRDSMK